MNNNKKLEELEQRQREIADEIAKLRDPKAHDPEPMDIYKDGQDDFVMVISTEHGLKCHFTGAEWDGNLFDFDEIRSDFVFIGTFDDVFITKTRVRSILTENKDEVGDNVVDLLRRSQFYGAPDALFDLKEEGIL